MSNVGRDGAQRLVAGALRHDPVAVVADDQRRSAPEPPPLDPHLPRVRVQGVLHQLRDGLARIALAAREPCRKRDLGLRETTIARVASSSK
jgi:hypothetical protein